MTTVARRETQRQVLGLGSGVGHYAVTAEAAAQCHIHATIVPAHYTVPALVEAIVEYFSKA